MPVPRGAVRRSRMAIAPQSRGNAAAASTLAEWPSVLMAPQALYLDLSMLRNPPGQALPSLPCHMGKQAVRQYWSLNAPNQTFSPHLTALAEAACQNHRGSAEEARVPGAPLAQEGSLGSGIKQILTQILAPSPPGCVTWGQ